MFLKSYYDRILQQQKGVIIAMTAVLLPLVFGFAGLAFDVGNLYVQKANLQNIADASALAGAEVYRKIATNKATSNKISADDSFDDNSYSTERPGSASFSTSNHGDADKSAWDYVEKNKGNHTISVNGPFALPGKVSVQTEEGMAQIDGVYYRVRLSEDVPLHFLPLLPGIGNRQTVEAESIVAFSTDTGTEATVETSSNIEYVKIFNNLFNYSGTIDDKASSSTSTNTYKASDQVNLRLYNYMVFMNHQYQGVTRDYDSNSISASSLTNRWGQVIRYGLNAYYGSPLKTQGRWFVNLQVTSTGNFTVDIDNNLNHPYYYLESNGNYYTWDDDYELYINNGYYLNDEGLKQAFPLPFYLYRENDTGKTPVGNTTINVTKNTNTDCYPVILYQFDKFNNTTTTVEINIAKGQIFRGIILATQSNVVINNNGTFEGTITAKNITTNGSGSFIHNNFFQNKKGVYAEWYENYLGLNYDDNGNPKYTQAELSDFIRQTKNDTASIWFYNHKGEKQNPASFNTGGGGHGHGGGASTVKNGYYYLDDNGKEVKLTSMDVSFYTSMYYRYYENGQLKLDLTQYEYGSQEWFEHLSNEQKARLGYYWEYYYKGYQGGDKMQWLWARPVTTTFTHTIEGTEPLKSLRLINSRTETNPFSTQS